MLQELSLIIWNTNKFPIYLYIALSNKLFICTFLRNLKKVYIILRQAEQGEEMHGYNMDVLFLLDWML